MFRRVVLGLLLCCSTGADLFLARPVLAQDAETEMSAADSAKTASKHRSFGYRYLQNKQYEDAETQLNKSWGFSSKSGSTARFLGRMYQEQENYEQAVVWYRTSIEVDPKGKYTQNAYTSLANLYVYLEEGEKAIEAFEALIGFSPEPDREVTYLHSLVSLFIEAEDYEKALEYASRWGELEPDSPDVRDMIAKLHLHTGGEDEAMVEMEKVLAMSPDDNETRERLAEMYLRSAQEQKAFDAYKILHAADTKNYLFLDNLLILGKRLSKSSKYVVGILRKLHELQPQNVGVIEELADVTESISFINKGLRQDPRNGKLLFMKGDHYYKKWQQGSVDADSINAMKWFASALKDPQWRDNAQRMIHEIDPPLTDEEKMRRKFFNKDYQKEEEVDTSGKK